MCRRNGNIALIGRVVGGDEVYLWRGSWRCGRDFSRWRDGWVGDAVEERLPWYHQEEHARAWRNSVKEKP
jgi:hypothetical protein